MSSSRPVLAPSNSSPLGGTRKDFAGVTCRKAFRKNFQCLFFGFSMIVEPSGKRTLSKQVPPGKPTTHNKSLTEPKELVEMTVSTFSSFVNASESNR